MMIECPNCGSDNITHSHRRGIERIARYVYPRVPYRCKECWTRFWKFRNPLGGGIAKIAAIAVLVICAGVAGWYFFLRQDQETSSSAQQKTRPRGGLVRKAPEKPIKRVVPTLRKQQPASPEPVRKPDASPVPVGKKADIPDAGIADANVEKPVPPRPKQTLPSSGSETNTSWRKPVAVKGTIAQPVRKPSSAKASQQVRRAGQTLKALQPESLENGFRLTLLADGPIEKYKTMSLEEPPPKFVIDLAGKWEYSGPYRVNVRSGMVRRIRVGRHPDFLRVVMDLKGSKVLIPVIEESADGLTMTIRK